MTGKDVYLQMTWSWPDKTWNILCSYCLQWNTSQSKFRNHYFLFLFAFSILSQLFLIWGCILNANELHSRYSTCASIDFILKYFKKIYSEAIVWEFYGCLDYVLLWFASKMFASLLSAWQSHYSIHVGVESFVLFNPVLI